MNPKCEICGTDFRREPGFYFGAMYVSYAFTVAFFVSIWIILDYLPVTPADWVYTVAMVVACIIFLPINFRYSRILFLYWFGGIRYRERDK